MSPTPIKHIEYRPETLFRRVLQPSDMVSKRLCTVWPESITLPCPQVGTHITIPGRPEEQGGEPQADAYFLPTPTADRALVEPKLTSRYGFVLVGPGVERDDLGNVRTLSLLSISSRRNAMDVIGLSDAGKDEVSGKVLCSAQNGDHSELYQRGYFVPEGDIPTEAEILAAETRRKKWLLAALRKGDRVWNNTQKLDAIPPEAIMASRFLNQPRVWAPAADDFSTSAERIACPVCTKPIERGVKKCLTCNEWLVYENDGSVWARESPDYKAHLVELKLAGKGKKAPEPEPE